MNTALEILQWGILGLAIGRCFTLERRCDALSTDLFRAKYTTRDEVMADLKTNELPVLRQAVLEQMGRPAKPAPRFNVQPIINRPVPFSVAKAPLAGLSSGGRG